MSSDIPYYTYEIEPSVISVEMGEWDQSQDGKLMYTESLSPCIGLALYDPNDKSGYMAHTCGSEIETLREMLTAAAGETTDITAIKAWVSGGELAPENGGGYDCSDANIREDVISLLESFGLNPYNINVEWVNDQIGNIYLDCQTGEGKIVIEEIPDGNLLYRPPESGL